MTVIKVWGKMYYMKALQGCAVAGCVVLGIYTPSLLLSLCIVIWAVHTVTVWALQAPVLDDVASSAHQTSLTEMVGSNHKLNPNRSISVPKDYKQHVPGCAPARRSQSVYERKKAAWQASRGDRKRGISPEPDNKATEERRNRIMTLRESLSWSDSIDLDTDECALQRNASIRASNRSKCSWTGSHGDLSETAEEEWGELADIKIWSRSCGNIRMQQRFGKSLQDSLEVDSWDGLHQILSNGTIVNSRDGKCDTGDQGKLSAMDKGTSGSTINLHYHWGTVVHMDHSSEVQIGNNNVMKVDKSGQQTQDEDTYKEMGCGDEDIFTDGQDEDLLDSETLDTDSVEYRVRECSDSDNQPVVTRCERTTSYHDPTKSIHSSQRPVDSSTRPLLERGTSYHDPTDDSEHKDMATGTTDSLMRGVRLEEYMDVLVHGHDADDHVFREQDTGDQSKLNIQEERNKLFEQMQKYRRLKSENEHLPRKKKGLFNKIKRKISN